MACFDIEDYLQRLSGELHSVFGKQLLYIGLQGSFRRGEANDRSDIDVVVILEELTDKAMEQYRQILHRIGGWERSCGFLCGRQEMLHWNRLEICQLVHETEDYYGRLADFVPSHTREDVRTYLKLGVGNLYHELCHCYLHAPQEQLEQVLPELYKAAFYLLQNRCWLQTGNFPLCRQELLGQLSGHDREVMKLGMQLRAGEKIETQLLYKTLFGWCQQMLWEKEPL